jgi:hypothetical protein
MMFSNNSKWIETFSIQNFRQPSRFPTRIRENFLVILQQNLSIDDSDIEVIPLLDREWRSIELNFPRIWMLQRLFIADLKRMQALLSKDFESTAVCLLSNDGSDCAIPCRCS